jgi:hypothetical protein
LYFLLSVFYVSAFGQQPWDRAYLNDSRTTLAAAVIADGAVVRVEEGGQTITTVVGIKPVSRVMFHWDAKADGSVLIPHLLGLEVDAAWLKTESGPTGWNWQGDELPLQQYPGHWRAPILMHWGGSELLLVADLDLRPCVLLYTAKHLAIVYAFNPPVPAGEPIVFRHLSARIPAASRDEGVYAAAARWRAHRPDDLEYPDLQPLNGAIDIQLQNLDQPLQNTLRLLADHGQQFSKVMFWGWTSDRHVPGTAGTGCCLKSGTIHPRYGVFEVMIAMARQLGVSPTLYFRGDDADLDAHVAAWDGVSRYVDVVGGMPSARRRYGPMDTIIEGVTAACDHSGLVSGSVTGGSTRVLGGSRSYERPLPWLRLVFDRRPLFLGDENFDLHWTNDLPGVCPQCRIVHAFQTYRAAFLWGCKLTVRDPGKPIVQDIVREWERVGFWARKPAYRGGEGIGSSALPVGVNVSRFRCADGGTLLAADQWGLNPPAEWVLQVDGKPVTLPAKRLAIVEVP